MLKPGKYLSGKNWLYTFVAENQKKQRIMRHRQFKTECVCVAMINKKVITCSELRGVKKKIYTLGVRGSNYLVDVVDKKTGAVYDTYLMKYTEEGAIFQKQLYSKWKEELTEAKMKQLTIIETS